MARPSCVIGASVSVSVLDKSACPNWGYLLASVETKKWKTKQTKQNQDAAARPSCVIGASVWASVLDKSACPNWAVPTGIS